VISLYLAIDVAPYKEAPEATREGFGAYLKERGVDENTWHCTVCKADVDGGDIQVSWNPPTFLPYCTTKVTLDRSCPGHGPALVPAAAD